MLIRHGRNDAPREAKHLDGDGAMKTQRRRAGPRVPWSALGHGCWDDEGGKVKGKAEGWDWGTRSQPPATAAPCTWFPGLNSGAPAQQQPKHGPMTSPPKCLKGERMQS